MPPSSGGRARGTMISPPSLAVRTAALSRFIPPRMLPGGRDSNRRGISVQSPSGREIRIMAWRLRSKIHASPSHPPARKAEGIGNSSGPPPAYP